MRHTRTWRFRQGLQNLKKILFSFNWGEREREREKGGQVHFCCSSTMTTPSAVMLKDARTSWLVGKEEKQDSRRREEEWLKIRLGTLNRVTAEVTTWWKETRVLRVLLVSLFLSFLFFLSWARGNGLKRVCLRGWLGGCRRKIVGGILKRRSAGINSHMAYVLFFFFFRWLYWPRRVYLTIFSFIF